MHDITVHRLAWCFGVVKTPMTNVMAWEMAFCMPSISLLPLAAQYKATKYGAFAA
jgi:hypothetical protein